MAENPFTKLLSNSPAKKPEAEGNEKDVNFQKIKINSLVEHIFELTVNRKYYNKHHPLIYMDDAAEISTSWTIELLENTLFERLLMT